MSVLYVSVDVQKNNAHFLLSYKIILGQHYDRALPESAGLSLLVRWDSGLLTILCCNYK